MGADPTGLAELGWRPFFSAQVLPEEAAVFCPVRVMAVHRGMIAVAGAGTRWSIPPRLPGAGGHAPAVGDWVLFDPATLQMQRILRRSSLFRRRAPGRTRDLQLIAANVDTLFVVASCNEDFNVARLERYLVLAREVGVTPVVVLTKADLAAAPETFTAAARAVQPGLAVETVNARDPASAGRLAAWCGTGQTVALLGSSGVGKSTLINTLRGTRSIATQPVREADGKGRHTTTVRELHRLASGGWLMDTPGMRELQLTDAASGLDEVFDDIVLAAQCCRFTNCAHGQEPGCAVQADLADGKLDPVRLERWRKLTAEDAANTALQATRRVRPRRPREAPPPSLRDAGYEDADD